MDRELMREELKRLVFNMLDEIFVNNKPAVDEVNFTINCLETLIGREFTPEESARAFGLLYSIIKRVGNR